MQSANKDLTHTIDLEVIRERTHAALETMRTWEDFCQKLLQCDPCCVLIGVSSEYGAEMHIIPHRQALQYVLPSSTGILSNHLPFSLQPSVASVNYRQLDKVQ